MAACCCRDHHRNYGTCLQCPVHGTEPPTEHGEGSAIGAAADPETDHQSAPFPMPDDPDSIMAFWHWVTEHHDHEGGLRGTITRSENIYLETWMCRACQTYLVAGEHVIFRIATPKQSHD